MKIKLLIALLISLFCIDRSLAQKKSKEPLVKVSVSKAGPYIGLQKGKYTVLELGGEYQWKKVRFKKPWTHAGHMGFNYNFKYNVLGYELGYWVKPHRVGLTYGANFLYRTNFDQSQFGVSPVVGFKFWFAHLQTGYQFLSNRSSEIQSNTFFISLRIGIINDRDVDIKWRKRKGK